MDDYWKVNHKSQRQQICYCAKHSIVQLGSKPGPYMNVPFFLTATFLWLAFVFSDDEIKNKLVAVVFFGLLFFTLPVLVYLDHRKVMSKAGHSRVCSGQIAAQSILYIAKMGSYFKPLSPEEEKTLARNLSGKVIDTQMDYNGIAAGVCITAAAFNVYFIIKLIDENATSIIYPIFFCFCIVVSTAILTRMKSGKIAALVFSLLNICSAALLLMLYVLAILFNYSNFSL